MNTTGINRDSALFACVCFSAAVGFVADVGSSLDVVDATVSLLSVPVLTSSLIIAVGIFPGSSDILEDGELLLMIRSTVINTRTDTLIAGEVQEDNVGAANQPHTTKLSHTSVGLQLVHFVDFFFFLKSAVNHFA